MEASVEGQAITQLKMQKPPLGHTLAVTAHVSVSLSPVKILTQTLLLQRKMAGADIGACEPYKPKKAAAEEGTRYMPGVSLPQQKQLKQSVRGAATAADEKSRPWESPENLFRFKHLLTAGSEPVSIILSR